MAGILALSAAMVGLRGFAVRHPPKNPRVDSLRGSQTRQDHLAL